MGSTGTTGSGWSSSYLPPRRSRWRRALKWVSIGLAVVVLVAVVGGYAVYRHLDGNITRIHYTTTQTGVAPKKVVQGAENILVIGSDTRAGTGGQYGRDILGARSDTVILVHLARGASHATLLSIPRDTYVQIPACQLANGTMSQPQMNKFNAAYSIGGPACTIKTVQHLTNIAIDHWLVIDFTGFKNMVNALGGVSICLQKPINDPVRYDPATGGDIGSGLVIGAGTHTLNGTQALGFVRSRYAVGDGSDLGRIEDQKAFISAVVRKATSTGLLLDPPKLYSFLDAATKSLTADSGFSLSEMRTLASAVRGVGPDKVKMLTLPLSNTDAYEDIGGARASVVLPDQTLDEAVFTAFRDDTPLPGEATATPSPSESSSPTPSPTTAPVTLTVPPGSIRVEVLNGTTTTGLAHTAANELAAEGFDVVHVGDAPSSLVTGTTVVRYGPSRVQSSQTVAAAVTGATTQLDPSLGGVVEIVLGNDFHGISPVTVTPGATVPSTTPTTGSPTPAPSLAITDAQSDTCAAA